MSGPYRCIAADPPWKESGGGKIKRGADRHYKLLSRDEIVRVMLASPAWDVGWDAHLWMWATSNHLPDALWVIEKLGCRYITSSVWVKMREGQLQVGLGQYMRHCHEWLLLASRGKVPKPAPKDRPPSVIIAPRTRHSEKPREAFTLIERVSPGPRIELFARGPRFGWDVWGDEVEP